MRCPKCKVISMYDDTDRKAGIQVYACHTCGNRVYVGYPIHRGERAESRGNGKTQAASPSPVKKSNVVVAFAKPAGKTPSFPKEDGAPR